MMRRLTAHAGPGRLTTTLLAAAPVAGAAATATPAEPALAGQGTHTQAPRAKDQPVATYSGMTESQRAGLRAIARDTWKFYGADIDPATNLPMDNITFAAAQEPGRQPDRPDELRALLRRQG
jgi:hypothetical protein